MKFTTFLLPCVALAAALPLALAQKNDNKFAVSAEVVAKIKAGLPASTPVPVKKKHEVLVFTKTAGFRHGSIPVGVETMKQLGEKTGLFSVTHTEDESAFEADSLAKYDGVIFLNTTGDVFQGGEAGREDRLKKNLVDFVSGGKALIGMHSATDTYKEWKEYNDMMGGAFVSHPWGSGDTVHVKNLDPKHPLNAAFNGEGFAIKDEIYKFRKDTAAQTDRRMLLALDPEGTDMKKDGGDDKRALYPIAWVDTYGKGRIFYCSLGHNDEVFWNQAVVKHYLAGIQYALGELDADATPKSVARIGVDGALKIANR